jgi:hypothetical protein
MPPPSAGSKKSPAETSMEQVAKQTYLLHAGFLLGLFFDHEDASNMFLRNIS